MNVWREGSEQWIQRAVDGLEKKGFAVLRNALDPEFVTAVREEIQRLQSRGEFQSAGIGKGSHLQKNPDIRRDGTYWFRDENASSLQKGFLSALEGVRIALNSALFLGLWDHEGHYAVYAPGAFYRKHLDRFQNDSKRTVSTVAFFNEGWKEADGGVLALELPEEELRILPEAGTIVFFLSDRIPHEVTETTRERLSFAGWFRSR